MFWAYLYIIVFALFDIFLFAWGIELVIASRRRLAPKVPSPKKLRIAAANQIKEYYPNAKTVLDVGCCYGGMARRIARACPKMRVSGIEKMLTPFLVAKTTHFFIGPRNLKFKCGDAFEFIKTVAKNNNGHAFDIGVTYLLTPMMSQVLDVMKHFDVLIVFDFPLPNLVPMRTIKLHRDYLGQHYMYVYETPRLDKQACQNNL